MPIENERKYVMSLGFDETHVADWRRIDIRQAYLDDGPRIRHYGDALVFTYKKFVPMTQELVEIETTLSADDFNLLWSLKRDALTKTRYEKTIGQEAWVVDFLRDDSGSVYFILAEVEMPRYQIAPNHIPEALKDHIIYAVEKDDTRFTNRKLSDPHHAAALLVAIVG